MKYYYIIAIIHNIIIILLQYYYIIAFIHNIINCIIVALKTKKAFDDLNAQNSIFKSKLFQIEIQRLLSEVVEDQTAPADVTSNGQPTTSLREDAQSRHTILSAKSAKSSKSQKTTHSATHPDGVSLPSGELSTVSMIQPTFFPADLLNAGVGLASEPPAKDADGAAKKTKPKKSKVSHAWWINQ